VEVEIRIAARMSAVSATHFGESWRKSHEMDHGH